MKTLGISIHILLLYTLQIMGTQENDDPESTKLINTYFNTLDHKNPPLYICNEAQSFSYRLPKQISCPLLKLDKPSKVVAITLWYNAVGQHTVDGVHCYSTKTTVRKSYFFFGSYSESTETVDMPVSAEECRLMHKRQMSPTNLPMNRIHDNAFSTMLTASVEYDWPNTREETIQNWYYSTVTISSNNVDQTLITPISLTETCSIFDNTCHTIGMGIIVWEGDRFQTCRLQKGASSLCLYSDEERITCPELQISINVLATIEICNFPMGGSSQGIMYSTDVKGSINEEIVTTEEVERIIQKSQSSRKTRETKQPKIIPKFEETEDESLPPLKQHNERSTTPKPTPKPTPNLQNIPKYMEDSEETEDVIDYREPIIPEQQYKPIKESKPLKTTTEKPTTKNLTQLIPTTNAYGMTTKPIISKSTTQTPPVRTKTTPTTNKPIELPKKEVPLGGSSIQLHNLSSNSPPTFQKELLSGIKLDSLGGIILQKQEIRSNPQDKTDIKQFEHILDYGEPIIDEPYDPDHYDDNKTKTKTEQKQTINYKSPQEISNIEKKHKPSEQYQAPAGGVSVFTDAQVNARLQYLFNIVNSNIEYAIQLVHSSTCLAQQTTLNLLRALAESSPGILIRTLLSDGRYTGQLSGDTLMISKCIPIHQYVFMMPNESTCTVEFPVKYIYNNQQYEGWMKPLSHEIVSEPELTACPRQNFYFDTGDDVILLNNKTNVNAHIPILQMPNDKDEKRKQVEIAFTSTGHVNLNQFDKSNDFYKFLKQTTSPNKIDAILRKHYMGSPLTPQQMEISQTLRKLTLDPIKEMVAKGMAIIAIIIVFIIMIKILICFRKAISQCMFKICCLPCSMIYKKLSGRQQLPTSINEQELRPMIRENTTKPQQRQKSRTETVLYTSVQPSTPLLEDPAPLYPDLPKYEDQINEVTPYNPNYTPSNVCQQESSSVLQPVPLFETRQQIYAYNSNNHKQSSSSNFKIPLEGLQPN